MRPQKDNVVYRFSGPWFLILCFGGWRVKHFHYTFRYLIVGSDQNQNLKLKSVFSTVKGKWKNVVETPKPVLRLYPLHGMLPLNVGGEGREGISYRAHHARRKTPGFSNCLSCFLFLYDSPVRNSSHIQACFIMCNSG